MYIVMGYLLMTARKPESLDQEFTNNAAVLIIGYST